MVAKSSVNVREAIRRTLFRAGIGFEQQQPFFLLHGSRIRTYVKPVFNGVKFISLTFISNIFFGKIATRHLIQEV